MCAHLRFMVSGQFKQTNTNAIQSASVGLTQAHLSIYFISSIEKGTIVYILACWDDNLLLT